MNFEASRPETANSVAQACRNSDHDSLQRFISGGCGRDGLRSKDNRGWEPIHEAVQAGSLECVRILEKEDCVDINAVSWRKETPLIVACQSNQSIEMVKLLIELGANVNQKDEFGHSPLSRVITDTDRREIVEALVEAGANVNSKTSWNTTPLHLFFMEQFECGPDDVFQAERALDLVKYFVEHGAEIDCADENHLTPFMMAAEKGFLSVCKYLLDVEKKQRNLNPPTPEKRSRKNCLLKMEAEDGANALMLACQNGHVKVVRLLLKESDAAAQISPEEAIDFNHETIDGCMAVHLSAAAKRNSARILHLILSRTDIEKVKQDTDHSLFHIAIERKNFKCLKELARVLPANKFTISLKKEDTTAQVHHILTKTFGYTELDPLGMLLIHGKNLSRYKMWDLIQSLKICLSSENESVLPPLLALAEYADEEETCGSDFDDEDDEDLRYDRDEKLDEKDEDTDEENDDELSEKQTILRYLSERSQQLDVRHKHFLLAQSEISNLFMYLQEGLITAREIHALLQESKDEQLTKIYKQKGPAYEWVVRIMILLKVLEIESEKSRKLLKTFISEIGKEFILELFEVHPVPSLKSLVRKEIHLSFADMSRKLICSLPVPEPLQEYLLFDDVSPDEDLRSRYKSTSHQIIILDRYI